MEQFGYCRAASVAEAIMLLNEPGFKNRPLAGSTDLILFMRNKPDIYNRVVDISLIPELHNIEQHGDQVIIGAAATFNEVLSHPLIKKTAPILADACKTVGAVQIRNMGTVGGNVANAAACADSLPALVCLNASARVLTPTEEFNWMVTELVLSPNKTRIPTGGLMVSLQYPIPHSGTRGVFLKLGRRNAMAISRLTVAALGRVDENGRIIEARFVTGSAAPQICHFQDVEASLIGQIPSPELMQAAGRLATDEMIKLSGNRWSSEFKVPALSAMTARALGRVFQVSLEKVEAA
jgi:CO/xanthine dehydrogenase FAD-binding subunit